MSRRCASPTSPASAASASASSSRASICLARTSAIENVGLPLYYAASGPTAPRERIERARAALQLLGLGDRERNTPGQLSGGQQQRVAIARALINAPSLLLADEPTGNLDTRTSHEIMETLRLAQSRAGLTIVLVTHEADIAAYADRIVTMRDGADRLRRAGEQAGVPDGRGASSSALRSSGRQSRRRLRRCRPAASSPSRCMILAAAAQAIGRNKMRSALTMLGVFIGVAALIAMVAVGEGANEAVRKQIESLGTNVVVILPGALTHGRHPRRLRQRHHAHGRRTRARSAARIPRSPRSAISSASRAKSSTAIRTGRRTSKASARTIRRSPTGTSPPGAASRAEDESKADLVVVIGQTVYRQLFSPGENPIGAFIQVKSVPLQVIGVLAAKGQSAFGTDQDDLVMIPFTTAERKVLGVAAPTHAANAAQLALSAAAQSLQSAAAPDRLRQP